MPSSPHRRKWLLASAAFTVVGGLTAILLLWSAARSRSNGPRSRQAELPYREEVIRFQAGGNTLAGVLTLPRTPGPHPAIVFVNGSGPADRTGNGMFPPLWRHFARHGFACLSWDRPGVGQSTGDIEVQDFPARAAEGLAALQFACGRSELRKDRVGLWGFSQGAAVVPLAAAKSADVAFVIAVSGHQLVAWKQDLYRVEAELRADGFSEANVAQAGEFAQMRMNLIRGSGLFEELDETQKSVSGRPWFDYLHYCSRKRFDAARLTVDFDPAVAWAKVQCPVLAVFGAKDTSTAAEESAAAIRKGLAEAGNRDLTVKVFLRADHGIAVSDTGGPKEASERAKARSAADGPEFAPGYLDLMTSWLEEHAAVRR